MKSKKHINLICGTALLSLALSPIRLNATEFYVSQMDGSDSYTGTSPTNLGNNNGPFRTINHAFSISAPGDVINILNGEYRESIVSNGKSGAVDQYITIQNYSGHQPILNGALDYSGVNNWIHYQGEIYYTTGINWQTGLVIQDDVPFGPGIIPNKDRSEASLNDLDAPGEFYRDDANHRVYVWAFGGGNPGQYKIEISKNVPFQIKPPSAYIRIRGLVLKNSMLKNAGAGVQIGNHCIVEECVFYNNRWGIVNGWPAATNVKIRYNEFYQCGDGVINWQADGGLIKGNIAHDNWDDGIALRGCSNFVIEQNLCYSNLGGGPSGNEGDGLKCCHVFGEDPSLTAARNCIIRNNICYNNFEDSMIIGGYNLEVYNNTLVGGDYGFEFYGSNNVVKNNLIVGQFTVGNFGITDLSSNDVDYNLWYRPEGHFFFTNQQGTIYRSLQEYQAATGWGQHSMFIDPHFVDYQGNDFHLQSTSPAIDSGLIISVVFNDFDGAFRPLGPTHDIGAYEFGGQTDEIPPNPPRELTSPHQTATEIELAWLAPLQAEDGDYASSYEIWRDDVFVTHAYGTFHSDTGLDEARSYQYKIYALDEIGNKSVEPAMATFSTTSDTIPPTLLSIRPLGLTSVKVIFTEPVETTSAETVSNFHISNGISVINAQQQTNQTSVILHTDTLTLGFTYVLSVTGVKDISANENETPPGTQGTFRLLADYYEDFEDLVADGWQPENSTRWQIVQDQGDLAYFLNTSNYDSPGGYRLGEISVLDSNYFSGSEFELICWARCNEELNANPHADYAIVFGYQDALNYAYLQVHSYNVILCWIENGQDVVFNNYPANVPLESYHKVDLSFGNDTLRVAINDDLIMTDSLVGLRAGSVGLGSYNDSVFFDEINIEVIDDDPPPAPPTGVMVTP